jgi:FecR protein
LVVATAFAPAMAGAADWISVATIREGAVTMLRGASRLQVDQCVRLQPDDVVETAPNAFVRLEFADGAAIDLGGATRILLNPPVAQKGVRPSLYVLTGWVKLTPPNSGNPAAAVSSPRFDLVDVRGPAVAMVGSAESSVFVEAGEATVIDLRRPAAAPVSVLLKSEEFALIKGENDLARMNRVPQSFVSSTPPPFRDTLPKRWSACADRNVAPSSAGTFSYQEVEPWLTDRAVGGRFARLWGAKVSDPAFREGLVSNFAEHPWWFPVLYPDCCDASQ